MPSREASVDHSEVSSNRDVQGPEPIYMETGTNQIGSETPTAES